jgi:hypothetical protein
MRKMVDMGTSFSHRITNVALKSFTMYILCPILENNDGSTIF